jgi:hypothetical protein
MALINRTSMKRFVNDFMDRAIQNRIEGHHRLIMHDGRKRFTIISQDLHIAAEEHLRQWLRKRILEAPAKGKTLR